MLKFFILAILVTQNLLLAAEPNESYFKSENLSNFYSQKILEFKKIKITDANSELIEQKILISNKIIKLINTKVSTNQANLPPKFSSSENFLDVLNFIVKNQDQIKILDEQYKNLSQRKKITKEKLSKVEGDQEELLQLHFALYQLKSNINTNKAASIKESIESTKSELKSKLNLYKVDLEDIGKNIEKAKADIHNRELKINRLILKSDLEAVEKFKDSKVYPEVKELEEHNKNVREQLFFLLVKNSLGLLQLQKSTETFEAIREIKQLSQNLDNPIITAQYINLDIIVNDTFGVTQAALGNTLSTANFFKDKVIGWINYPLWESNGQKISLIDISKVLVLIIAGIMIGQFYKARILLIKKRWPNTSLQSVKFLSNFGFYIIIIITLSVALNIMGIDLSSLSLIAGALSIGIGFGLQTIVSNFISGIILIFERRIRIGDRIEISQTIKGVVTDINIRSTTLRGYDKTEVIIPNSTFMQSSVINWTLEDSIKRLQIPFGVEYGSNSDEVERMIVEALQKSGLNYVRNNPDYTPHIRMSSMNTSSVDFQLTVWINYASKTSVPADFHFMKLIYETLNENKISIPFPQMDLHIKSSDAIIQTKVVI